MIAAALLMAAVQAPTDTIRVRAAALPPTAIAALGEPSVRIPTGQGSAALWLLATTDSAFVVARIPDSTWYWGDDLVVSLDVEGDGGAAPGHDDFQWYLRRMLDSSVVYRGRGGRWEAPRGDPSWRLGPEREGGGWTVSSASDSAGWTVVLRLGPAWLASRPRVAFRIYDDSPGGWHAWPAPAAGKQGSGVERVPDLWGLVQKAPPATDPASHPR